MSPDTSLQAGVEDLWRPSRHRVTVPIGLAVLVAGLVLGLPHVQAPRLGLEPYAPRPLPETLLAGSLGDLVTTWPWVGALLAGSCGLLLFLVVEALVRRFWHQAQEAAALLVAAGFVALPAQAALLRLQGSETLLPALALVLAGARLALARAPGWSALGLLVAILSVLVHPAPVVLLPGVVGCAAAAGHLPGRVRPLVAFLGGALIAYGLLRWQDLPLAPPLAEAVASRRPELAARGLAALPALLVDPSVRAVLPTGHAALAGTWPVFGGAFVLLMIAAFGFMIVGIVRSSWVAVSTAVAALAGPWLVPGWVPGDRGLLLLAALPILTLLGTLLGAFRPAPLRLIFFGLAIGIGAVGVVFGYRREPWLETRTLALGLPRRVTPSGQLLDLDFAAERDPARLALYSRDVPRSDPFWGRARDAAMVRLHEGEPAMDALRLRDLHRSPVLTPGRVEPAARELLQRLEAVKNRLSVLEERWPRSRQRIPFVELAHDLEVLGPEILEYHFGMPRHHESVALVRRYKSLASDVAHVASRVGWPALARPLREVVVELSHATAKAHEAAILGRDLLDMGEYDAAIEVLGEAVPGLRSGSVIGVVSRGALGRARAARGEREEGLALIDRAWSALAASTAGATDLSNILRVVSPGALEYYLLAELLLARHELTLELRPALAAQTRRDLEALLNPVLASGRRRGAALALQGRLHALEGERGEAVMRLRELARMETPTMEETADGPTGRINLPTFRLPALRTLRDLLDPAADAEEIAALDAEIEGLEREVRFGEPR